MKKLLGVALILVGILLAIGVVAIAIKNLLKISGEPTDSYKAGYIVGTIISLVVLSLICYLLFKYGIRFFKASPSNRSVIDDDILDRDN